MSDHDELLAKLNAGRAICWPQSRTSDAQSATQPAGEGWSALECLEHVATVKTLLLRSLQTQSSEVAEELSRARPFFMRASLLVGRKFPRPK